MLSLNIHHFSLSCHLAEKQLSYLLIFWPWFDAKSPRKKNFIERLLVLFSIEHKDKIWICSFNGFSSLNLICRDIKWSKCMLDQIFQNLMDKSRLKFWSMCMNRRRAVLTTNSSEKLFSSNQHCWTKKWFSSLHVAKTTGFLPFLLENSVAMPVKEIDIFMMNRKNIKEYLKKLLKLA